MSTGRFWRNSARADHHGVLVEADLGACLVGEVFQHRLGGHVLQIQGNFLPGEESLRIFDDEIRRHFALGFLFDDQAQAGERFLEGVLIESENRDHHRAGFRLAALAGDGRSVEFQLAEAVNDVGIPGVALESLGVKIPLRKRSISMSHWSFGWVPARNFS